MADRLGDFREQDVALVASQSGCSRESAYDALMRHAGDIVDAIIYLNTTPRVSLRHTPKLDTPLPPIQRAFYIRRCIGRDVTIVPGCMRPKDVVPFATKECEKFLSEKTAGLFGDEPVTYDNILTQDSTTMNARTKSHSISFSLVLMPLSLGELHHTHGYPSMGKE